MSWWQYLFAVLTVLVAAAATVTQYFENDTLGESYYLKAFSTFVAANKLWSTFALSIVAGLGTITTLLFQPRKARRQFRESLMDGIFEQLLGNDRTNARITLFKDVGRLRTWWFRLWDFASLVKRGRTVSEAALYSWEANYIRIFDRWGTEHKNSKTYFCVNFQTSEKCQGVAGQVRQQEAMIVVKLPRIDEIDLENVDESHPVVKEYMEQGHIKNFRVLCSIKRKAPFIYGHIISANGGRKKYVLVIDSWANRTPFTKPAIQRALPAYVKQISASFG
jgi:hypothetical protein